MGAWSWNSKSVWRWDWVAGESASCLPQAWVGVPAPLTWDGRVTWASNVIPAAPEVEAGRLRLQTCAQLEAHVVLCWIRLRTKRKVRSFLSHIPFVLNSFSTQYFYWFFGNFTSCTLTRSFPSPPMSVPAPLWPHFPPNKTQKKTGSICVAHMRTGSWSNSQGPPPQNWVPSLAHPH